MTETVVFILLMIAIGQSVRARHYRKQFGKMSSAFFRKVDELVELKEKHHQSCKLGMQWMNKYFALRDGETHEEEAEWPEEIS
jgi:hypothetical protein